MAGASSWGNSSCASQDAWWSWTGNCTCPSLIVARSTCGQRCDRNTWGPWAAGRALTRQGSPSRLPGVVHTCHSLASNSPPRSASRLGYFYRRKGLCQCHGGDARQSPGPTACWRTRASQTPSAQPLWSPPQMHQEGNHQVSANTAGWFPCHLSPAP